MRIFAIVILCLGLALTGCASGPRSEVGLADRVAAQPVGFAGVRFTVDTEPEARRLIDWIGGNVPVGPDGRLDLLALSGGGANGAFAAGVINGWTAAGTRPDFEIVTGVSTGALAAPFVFLGPEWDDALREAYTSGQASDLLRSRGLGALVGSGVFSGEPLRELVERYVDQALLDAVAAEHRRGRLLLVATTDLDLERGVVWNMGAIAVEGGLGALPLFRDVLIASASVPGVFPPVLISAEGPGGVFEEMHVDGGVLNSFIALPEALWAWEGPADAMAGARVHVIINGKARSGFRVTRDAPVAVLSRSLDAMMKAEVRSNLAGNRAFARRHGLEFRAAVIPDSVDIGNGFDFSPETMRLIYELGYFRAVSGEAWTD